MARRHDLDSLRAIAMLLGIVLHGAISMIPGTGMYWAIQDSQQREWLGVLNAAIHGFRMPLFFLISGFFTAMLWRKRGLKALAAHRFKRIFIPLVIGMLTIIPASWIVPALLRSSATASQTSPRGDSEAAASRGDALVAAAATGDVDQLESLLAEGIDANAVDQRGSSALHAAVFFGRADVVRVLIEAGADRDLRNADGKRAVDGLQAPWWMANAFADGVGIALDQEEFEEGRREIATLLGDDPRGPAIPSHWAGGGILGLLMQIPLLGHLWFLWFLCWLVTGFIIIVVVAQRLSLPSIPRSLVAGTWRYVWVVPLAAVAELMMNFTGQTEFGPATSIGPIPMPSVLAYYAIFFFFGALYFDTDDTSGQLGKHWWITLPVALLFCFPMGLALQASRTGTALVASAFCQAGYAWMFACGLIGAFRHLLSAERPVMRYISDSSYWLYLVHIPLIYLPQYWVRTWTLAPVLKLVLIVGTTTVVLLASYQGLVRYTWIGRMLNGPRVRPRNQSITANDCAQPNVT